MKRHQCIQAHPQPDGVGHQITYQDGTTRKVHRCVASLEADEPAPHAAGSYHDPEHHHTLMARIDDYLRHS